MFFDYGVRLLIKSFLDSEQATLLIEFTLGVLAESLREGHAIARRGEVKLRGQSDCDVAPEEDGVTG